MTWPRWPPRTLMRRSVLLVDAAAAMLDDPVGVEGDRGAGLQLLSPQRPPPGPRADSPRRAGVVVRGGCEWRTGSCRAAVRCRRQVGIVDGLAGVADDAVLEGLSDLGDVGVLS